jgi:hypothetical protein
LKKIVEIVETFSREKIASNSDKWMENCYNHHHFNVLNNFILMRSKKGSEKGGRKRQTYRETD